MQQSPALEIRRGGGSYLVDSSHAGATLGPLAKLMMSQAPNSIRQKHPDLKPFQDYCQTFKDAIKGKFAGGGEPGSEKGGRKSGREEREVGEACQVEESGAGRSGGEGSQDRDSIVRGPRR